MACNLPIITTPVFGIAEQIRPGINALTYQPGDVSTLIQHLDRLTKDGLLRFDRPAHPRLVLQASPKPICICRPVTVRIRTWNPLIKRPRPNHAPGTKE